MPEKQQGAAAFRVKDAPVGIKMETSAVREHSAVRGALLGAQLGCLIAAASWGSGCELFDR